MSDNDLILRAAALEVINAVKGVTWSQSGKVLCGKMFSQIKDLSAVDAVPVVHGRWITNKHGETVCSECDNNALQVLTGCLVNRHFEPHKSEFCPNCGAKMDGERRDDE